MSDRQDGGPAFPCEEIKQAIPVWHNGMTLRDYFAGQALAGFCDTDIPFSPRGAAERCYAIADAMLAERGTR